MQIYPTGTSKLKFINYDSSLIAAGHYYYGVRILTGSQPDAGKDWRADIRITLVGSQARSDGDQMFSWWEYFGSDNMHYDDLILECSESLGQVQVVLLENKATNAQSWYVDFVEVNDVQTADKQIFPCYHWIGADDTVSCSSSTSKTHLRIAFVIIIKHVYLFIV